MSGYQHKHQAGSHADVLKQVVFIAAVQKMQEKFPEGIMIVDTHAGPGVYDGISEEFKKGAARCKEKNLQAPPPVKKYVSLLNKLQKEFGEGTVPGSPLFARELMRDQDEHRLMDLYTDVEGVYEDAIARKTDSFHPDAFDFICPEEPAKHPVILIDPAYEDDNDLWRAKDLMDRILTRKSDACICLWIPLIRNDRHRWSFPKGLKDLAKERASVGRYYCQIVVDDKGLEGSAMLVSNPTNDMDEIINEDCLNWMAHTMHKGKADYSVEQAMKKKKKVIHS